jgi:pilus assembly protein Flp/PilA
MIQVFRMEKGQGIVEYALIFALVILIVIVLVYLLGPAIGNMYSDIVTNLANLK